MTKEQAIDKVKKLLALSSSPNENEALLAASKAQKILYEYNLSISDVKVEEGEWRNIFERKSLLINMDKWECRLPSAIAQNLDCISLYRKQGNKYGISFVGTKTAVEICDYLFEYLYLQIVELVKKREELGERMGKYYMDGMMDNLQSKLEKAFRVNREEYVRTGKDLILMNQKNAKEFLHQRYPNLKEETIEREDPDSMLDFGDYLTGFYVGHSIQVRKGIDG